MLVRSLFMEFIKQMKKREFIEMGLKAFAALLAAFLAIILMEGMIYGIQLHSLLKKSTQSLTYSSKTIAYCIEQDDDKYAIIYYNEGESREWWCQSSQTKTLEQIKSDDFKSSVKEVVMHAPNAFEFSITNIHYVVMAVFVCAVMGFFTYKFVVLNKEYARIVDNYNKTGTIEIG